MEGHRYTRRPERPAVDPLKDMLEVAATVLGPQQDENGKERWWQVTDVLSPTGLSVSSGTDRFIYGKSNIGEKVGLKRVNYNDNGRVVSVATMAIRTAEEEFRWKGSGL